MSVLPVVMCERCGAYLRGAELHLCPKVEAMRPLTLPLDLRALTYTDTPPTVPGWYAVRPPSGRFSVINVTNTYVNISRAERWKGWQFGPLIAPLVEEKP